MTVETIPSDELIEMSDLFHRSFNAAGCDPMCHCCEKMIPIGSQFKLATVFIAPNKWGESAYFQKEVLLGNKKAKFKDYLKFFKLDIRKNYEDFDTKSYRKDAEKYSLESKEVMLCEKCNPETFQLKELEYLEKEIIRIETPQGGCFRINGKIIH